MDEGRIAELKLFVDHCKSNPSVLNDPSLAFFRDFLQSLGAHVPQDPKKERDEPREDDNLEEDIVESDIELDEAQVLEPDNDPPQQMGDPSLEITEENQEAAQLLKSKAMDAISEGKLDKAIEHLSEAIMLYPTSAILYAARANVFVKTNKPNAAIRDADAALQINSNSAKGYKFRGIARAMLGKWEDAAKDLRVASNLDYDDEIGSILKKVEPNAHRIEEHHRKYERLRKQRELQKSENRRQRQSSQPQDSESVSALKDGHVLAVHSASELKTKLNAASSLSRLVILYFTATWCGPCRYMSPLYESLAKQYPKVVFVKVDIDMANDVAASWNISSVPTFFFVKDGKEIDKVVGADKGSLERKIARHAA